MRIFACAQLTKNCLKLTKKFRLIRWMFLKLKINTAWNRSGVFIAGFDHIQYINIVFLLLTSNKYLSVECERQVIMFWKHKKRNICFVIKIARPISFSDSSLHRIEINYGHIMRICFSFKYPLKIPSVLSLFDAIIWSFISSIFPRHLIFFAVPTENLFKSLKKWNKLAGTKSATLIIQFMT